MSDPTPKPANLVVQKQQSTAIATTFSDPAMQDTLVMAQYFMKSGAIPSSLKNEAQVFMVVQAGKEKGMSPIQSLRAFYIVNGRISMYGEAVPARLYAFGLRIKDAKIVYEEGPKENWGATVTLWDTKLNTEFTYTYKWEDAVRAKLTGKDLWRENPKNMMYWKAIGFAMDIWCPWVLDGISIKEDIEDLEEPQPQPPAAPSGRYGTPLPEKRHAEPESVPATFTDVEETPEPQKQEEPAPTPAPEPEPLDPKAEMRRIGGEFADTLTALGFAEEEQHKDIMKRMGVKKLTTPTELEAIHALAKLTSEIVAYMDGKGLELKDSIFTLTEGKCDTVYGILCNSDRIGEWHASVFA